MRKPLLVLCLALVLLPTAASARRASPLEGQPAIRHRQEVRKGRFELGPSVNLSLNRFVRHSFLFGAKLTYHFNDWLSLGADLGYGIGVDNGLTGELAKQYVNEQGLWDQLKRRFADVQFAGDVRVMFTPLSGKIGLFSKLFVGYDMYIFGGFGFALLKNGCETPADCAGDPADDFKAASAGFRPGASWGLGFHLFFNRFVSFGAELKDLLFSDNQDGGDMTRGLSDDEKDRNNPARPYLINGEDRKFSNHFYVGINLTFFLPPSVEISR